MFHVKFLCIFEIYPVTKFHVARTTGSLVTDMKQETKYRFYVAAM